MNRLRALMLEDNPDDCELVLRELTKGGYQVDSERVETAEAMAAALERRSWDVIFSDWAMPAFSAPAALEVLKQTGLDLPFIIVSGTIGEETAVEALHTGAHDFLVKNRLARLVPAVERELREAAMRKERAKMQEQLMVSDRMASVGILAAGVAHEINNPLAAILANLEFAVRDLRELAAQQGESTLLRDLLEEIGDTREAAQSIRDIVRDLKIFSRSEEDKRAAIDVRRVLDSSLRMAWNEIRHRARLVKSYETVPLVYANESRLGQVFLNLIVNAVHAIPEGRAQHNEIRVRTAVGAGGRVVVEIGDSGSGMTPEVLKRLFTPFFTTKPIGVGTGLGLSICHRIVSALGGEITVASKVGAGSTFTVALPVATEVMPAEMPASTSSAPPARRGRVLVIDDELIIGRAVTRTLGGDHEVVVVSQAREALAMLSGEERFDVILCDLMMPEMTGMDFHEALSASDPEQAKRIIFLTGGAFTVRARTFLDHAPNLRIEKPFDPPALRALVNERVR
jgi:signal transduction histidine kinase